MDFGSGKTLYQPGEKVPKAGIYRVLHKDHRSPHETGLRSEQTFPACNKCGKNVRFELVMPVSNG